MLFARLWAGTLKEAFLVGKRGGEEGDGHVGASTPESLRAVVRWRSGRILPGNQSSAGDALPEAQPCWSDCCEMPPGCELPPASPHGAPPSGCFYCSHFTDEQTEAQRHGISQDASSWKWVTWVT